MLDSGNFSDNPTPQGEIKTRGLLEGMARLGYAVANIGDRELSLGYSGFKKRTADVKFPLVSANIVRQDTGAPVFEPYTVVAAKSPDGKHEVRVAVLGATRYNPLFMKAGPDGANLVIAKPDEMLARYVPEARTKADIVVLLAALHKEEAKRIVRAVDGIDFVVGSYGGMITAREEREGDTWLLYAGNQGKRVGEARVYMAEDGALRSVESNMYLLTKRYPSNETMLEFVNGVAGQVAAEAPDQAVSGSAARGGAAAR